MEKSLGGAASATVTAVVAANAFYAELTAAVYELRWMILAVVVLVVADFVTGLTASVRLKGEDFRFSRAGRRTGAKLLEYFGYLIIGVALGKGLEPLGMFTYMQFSALRPARHHGALLDKEAAHRAHQEEGQEPRRGRRGRVRG